MTARLKDAIVELEARVQERDEEIASLMDDLRRVRMDVTLADANVSQCKRLLAYERRTFNAEVKALHAESLKLSTELAYERGRVKGLAE